MKTSNFCVYITIQETKPVFDLFYHEIISLLYHFEPFPATNFEMQFITRAVRVNNNNLLRNVAALINGNLSRPSSRTTNVVDETLSDKMEKVSRWMKYNEKVYPPQDPSEPPRPAVIILSHFVEHL